ILDAVVRAVDVPVTLKIRTGWDSKHRNGVNIAGIAEGCGVAALAIHGRTRADFFEGTAEYHTIRDIKSRVRIPGFANGDIDSPQKAREVLDFTGADGVMVGRASHGAPWIFRTVNAHVHGGIATPALQRAELRDIILHHLDSLYSFYGEESGVRIARKHLGWYCEQLLGSPAHARQELMGAANTATQFAHAVKHFAHWAIQTTASAGWRVFFGGAEMTAKKKPRSRETIVARVNGRELPLRNHAERALSEYFTSLNGHRPAHLYDLVLREVEEPLFRVVLDYAEGNQSRAAGILGINRGTLRKKLKQFGLGGS